LGKLADQLAEDRLLRDTARGLFMADVEVLRSELDRKGVGARIGSRVGEGAANAAEEAVGYADANRGAVAATLGAMTGALALWLARKPIMSALHTWFSDDGAEDDPEEQDDSPAERQQ
jgi:hypothetical protein